VKGSEGRMGFGVSRWVHAYATPGPEAATQTIDVELEARFTMFYERDLGFAKYKATYQRAPGQKRFSLREVRPFLDHGRAISNKDYEKLANIEVDDGISNELLLDLALPGLKRIATSSTVEEREWLRTILGFSKDTPAKRALQNLLNRKR
jgi:hypothetical protein